MWQPMHLIATDADVSEFQSLPGQPLCSQSYIMRLSEKKNKSKYYFNTILALQIFSTFPQFIFLLFKLLCTLKF